MDLLEPEERISAAAHVDGPTVDDLPPPDTRRWVAGKKAQVAAAVQNGILSVDEACRRYQLTVEELSAWQRALRQFGVRGLRATRRVARPAEIGWFSHHG